MAGFAEEPVPWLTRQMRTYTLKYMLAHADDGVIWGRLDGEELIISHTVAPEHSPPLRTVTLQTVRLFAPAGELLVWRDESGAWKSRLIAETALPGYTSKWITAFDEQQILWGTNADLRERGFSLMREGSQGLVHIVPLHLTEPIGEQRRPLQLVVRHYLTMDDYGFMRVNASRLMNLLPESEGEQHMTILKPWPEHQNPNQMRTAHAPYNFVPLPEKIIAAVDSVDDLPDHDEYDRTLHSGYFDVMLTTRSPLYIRGPVPAKDFPRQEQDSKVKNKPEFFHTGDEQTPVIPASSLRGMLRGLLEIVSYGKMQWVSEKQLFFRTVDRTTIGDHYRERMGDHVETGFLYRQGDRYSIRVCSMARVRRSILGNLYSSPSPQWGYPAGNDSMPVSGSDFQPKPMTLTSQRSLKVELPEAGHYDRGALSSDRKRAKKEKRVCLLATHR